MRDALSTLDQLASTTNDNITEESVLSMFGLVSRSALESLAGAVLGGDAAAILAAVEMFDSAGKDMRRLAAELLVHFRNLVVVQAAGTQIKSLEATPEQLETLSRQASMADAGRVFRICDMFSELDDKLRKTLSPRTVLEIALLRAGRIASTATIDELLAAVRALRDGSGASSPARETRKPESAAPAPGAAPTASVAAAAPSRQAILDDPRINGILSLAPGAKIADIKE